MITVNFPDRDLIINQSFKELFYNKDRYLLLWGGRGSSKSNFTAKKLIVECVNNKYFRYILIRNTYATIKDSQYQTIKDIIEEWGLEALFTFKENPLEIRCKNGNLFYARGCDDVAKIKSIKDPTGAWYEEANEISEDDFLTITTSIRTTKADFLQEILTFNPETEQKPEEFWINKWFFNGKPTNKQFTSTLTIKVGNTVLETQYTCHHSTYHDNQWIGPQFIAFLEYIQATNPYYYDVYCKGIWGTKEKKNTFIYTLQERCHFDKSIQIDYKKQLLIQIDFNLNPFAVVFANIYKDEAGLHGRWFNELSIENGSLQAMADRIKALYPQLLMNCMVTGDSMGKNRNITMIDNASNYETLRRMLGLRESQIVVPNNPTHKKSRNDCNYLLHIACNPMNKVDMKINTETCPGLANDLRSVQCDAEGSIIKGNRSDLNQRADFIDCWRAAVNTWLSEFIDRHQKQNLGR